MSDADTANQSTIADISDVQFCKRVIGMSASNIAAALGVSRQAVHLWETGAAISQENAERLAALVSSADALREWGLPMQKSHFIRAIEGGRGFIDLVAAGADPAEVAQKLVAILQTEAAQRERLRQRLGERANGADFSEAGIPMLDERDDVPGGKNTLGECIRALRHERGLSCAQLGEMVGVVRTTISRLERGDRGIDVDRLYQLAAALGVEAWMLLAGDCGKSLDTLDQLSGAIGPHMERDRAMREDADLVAAYVRAVGILRRR